MNNYEMDVAQDEPDYQYLPQAMETPAVSTPQAEDLPFAALAAHLDDNLATATLKLVDAARDFTGLIKAYVDAGKELERSLQMVKELSAASQFALSDARQAASEASASAAEAKQAQQSSFDLIQRATKEHMALADLTDSLRMRISALAVLGAPLVREAASEDDKSTQSDSEAA